MSAVRFEAVSKHYGGVVAVADLDLACGEGEMVALLGPSGCGKSSTLKMAAGIETVSSGEIFFGERGVSRLSPGERNIAMVFEDYALYPHLTVRQNIAFPLSVRGAPAAEAKRRVDDALAILGLQDLADRGVRGLSGGAQQRVSIGRALVRDPDLILFDEPLSHLDADQKVQLRTEIKRLQKISAVTSILVTHDQTEATAMADRIAVMNHGVLQQVATPEALYERPANLFVAGFIGEPPMNLMPARATAAGAILEETGWPVTLDERRRAVTASSDGSLVVGIRPEHVRVLRPDAAAPDRAGLAVVRFREPRGDVEVLMLAPADGSGPRLVAEIPGPAPFRAGDTVAVAFMTDRVHLFSAATGANLEAAW